MRIQLSKLQKRLKNKGFDVEFTDNLINSLAEQGFDPIYGARPLKRIIQREIENVLANKIIAGELSINKGIKVDIDGGDIVIR